MVTCAPVLRPLGRPGVRVGAGALGAGAVASFLGRPGVRVGAGALGAGAVASFLGRPGVRLGAGALATSTTGRSTCSTWIGNDRRCLVLISDKVNLSRRRMRDRRDTDPNRSVLDLKAHYRGRSYAEEVMKLLPEKPELGVLRRLLAQVTGLGRIHRLPVDRLTG